ncbi:hypothetical protein BH11MYX1_BH11MYX1_56500 [soil metagenome]
MTLSISNISWKDPGAPLILAHALGQIAADLWLAGKTPLTKTPIVATVGVHHGTHAGSEVTDDQAEGLGSRPEAVA